MYNPSDLEPEILEFWENNQIFNKLRERNRGKKRYSFIDGPITANNPMGVHHAWGRTYKDIYQRLKAMQGFDQRYQNGFDCQGLWVEVGVEKELGFNSKKDIIDFGLDKFSEACKARVDKYSKIQTQQSIRLGQWMDWDNPYYTHTDNNIEHIWHFLKVCKDNNWLYKGHQVMPWCTRCGTSLSQHELADSYREMTHKAVYLRLKLKNKENEFILVWTTTPWTLSSNVAAAVNPDLDYVQVSKQGTIYYLSEKTLSKLGGEYIVLDHIKGKELIGLEYESMYPELPVQQKVKHKIIEWGEVGEEEGTGIVHIAPGCGAEDNVLGKKIGLDIIAPIDETGTYLKGFNWQTGKNIKDMLEPILEDLKKKEILYKMEDYKHRYPVCWRCADELAFRLVDEWFISSEEIRPRMIKAAKTVKWVPGYGEKLMIDWLNNMDDWCISRKRFWGLPLPIWQCKNGHETFIETKKELEEKAVEGLPIQELHRPWIDAVKIKCPECGEISERIKDVGDCWLDAGIVPFSTLSYLKDKEYWKQWYPADLVVEMREQIRLWFYSLLFMSVTLKDQAPYKSVFAHEKVHAEDGRPMHKSWGNAIWFDEAVEKIGADVMRWVYTVYKPHQNLIFGYSIAKTAKQTLMTIFNLEKYLKDYIVNNDFLGLELKAEEDLWIISRLNNLKRTVTENMEALRPNLAVTAIENFFLNDLSRTYIQFVRERLNTNQNKKEVIYCLYTSLFELLKVLSPFTPFLTEKIYQDTFRQFENKESIHLFYYPQPDKACINLELEKDMEITRQVIQSILGAREKAQLGLRWPVKEVVVECDEKLAPSIKKLQRLIKQQTNIKALIINSNIPEMNIDIEPNHKTLGPKFGKQMPKVIKYLETNKNTILKDIRVTGTHTFKLENEDQELRTEDIKISKQVPEPYLIGEFKQGHIYLNRERDSELDLEGFARELTRRIQQARKEAELIKSDKIKIYIKSDLENLETHKNHIQQKVGAEEITISATDPEETFNHHFDHKIKSQEFFVMFSKV